MKKTVLIMMVLAFFASAPAFAAEGVKIGIVNEQKVVDDSEYGKKMNAEVDALFKSKNAEVEKALNERNKKGAAIKKSITSGLMSEDARLKAIAEFEQYAVSVDEFIRKTENDMRRYAMDIEMDIKKDLFGIIQVVGDDMGFTVIFSYDKVLYVDKDAVDISDEVIKRYNALKSGGGATK